MNAVGRSVSTTTSSIAWQKHARMHASSNETHINRDDSTYSTLIPRLISVLYVHPSNGFESFPQRQYELSHAALHTSDANAHGVVDSCAKGEIGRDGSLPEFIPGPDPSRDAVSKECGNR